MAEVSRELLIRCVKFQILEIFDVVMARDFVISSSMVQCARVMPFSEGGVTSGQNKRSTIFSATEKGVSKNLENTSELLRALGWKFYKAGDGFCLKLPLTPRAQ